MTRAAGSGWLEICSSSASKQGDFTSAAHYRVVDPYRGVRGLVLRKEAGPINCSPVALTSRALVARARTEVTALLRS